MATIANTLRDWASTDDAKVALYSSQPSKLLRWINEAQLRFAKRSEMIRDVWSPTITSTGNIALPDNFLREIKDRVKLDANTYLRQIAFSDARLLQISGTYYYSIWNNTFYVWSAGACTPSVPYITKPAVVLLADIATTDLEIPTEYHHTLFLYLDSMWAREQKDIAGSIALLKQFDNECDDAKVDYVRDNEPVPMTNPSMF